MTGDVRPVLVGLLAEHQVVFLTKSGERTCTCLVGPYGSAADHRAHVADVIASAGVVVATSEVAEFAAETQRVLDAAVYVLVREGIATTLPEARALVAGARGGAQ